MQPSHRIIETDGLTLIVNVDPLLGFAFEPDTMTVADQTGEIKTLVWHRENDNTFRLGYVSALSIGDALSLNNDILKSCARIIRNVPEAVAKIKQVMALYTDHSQEGLDDLFDVAQWLGDGMAQIRALMCKEPDPQQKAAILLRSICAEQSIADINLRRIVAQVATRNASIETARQENLRILDDLVEKLGKFVKNKRFKERDRNKKFSSLWYHGRVTELKQIIIPTYRLWCTPYTQLAAELHNRLAEVIDFLNQGKQFDAVLKIQEIIAEIGQWQVCLDKIKKAGTAIKQSTAWDTANFAQVAVGLDNLEAMLNDMPYILRLVQKLLRQDFDQINDHLKHEYWPQAGLGLDRLIARCKW